MPRVTSPAAAGAAAAGAAAAAAVIGTWEGEWDYNGAHIKCTLTVKDDGTYEQIKSFVCSTGLHDATPRGIYLDGLVDTIDAMVERTEDYASRVRSQYGM